MHKQTHRSKKKKKKKKQISNCICDASDNEQINCKRGKSREKTTETTTTTTITSNNYNRRRRQRGTQKERYEEGAQSTIRKQSVISRAITARARSPRKKETSINRNVYRVEDVSRADKAMRNRSMSARQKLRKSAMKTECTKMYFVFGIVIIELDSE